MTSVRARVLREAAEVCRSGTRSGAPGHSWRLDCADELDALADEVSTAAPTVDEVAKTIARLTTLANAPTGGEAIVVCADLRVLLDATGLVAPEVDLLLNRVAAERDAWRTRAETAEEALLNFEGHGSYCR